MQNACTNWFQAVKFGDCYYEAFTCHAFNNPSLALLYKQGLNLGT